MRDPGVPFEAEAFLKRLPQKAGVYQMLDASGAVLYVGKARSLKSPDQAAAPALQHRAARR
ncbi:MAG: hypothetical protein NT024_10550 [Proteobacteria bacterium]|nr:hypothetical protein [Pseudomonadota bacterium]